MEFDTYHTPADYRKLEYKLQKIRLKNSTMKNQLSKINRIMARDLGDNFDPEDALEE